MGLFSKKVKGVDGDAVDPAALKEEFLLLKKDIEAWESVMCGREACDQQIQLFSRRDELAKILGIGRLS